MQLKSKMNFKLVAILTILLASLSNLVFAEDESKSKVPVWAIDGATAASVPMEKALYMIGGAKASLKRKKDKIRIKVKTAGLPLGAYTTWWVIYNQPSNCAETICQFSDLANSNTDGSVLWATGAIVKGKEAKFRADLTEGEVPGQIIAGSGLTNALGAQVEYVIKWHGPASDNPDTLHEQLYNLADPNCETAPEPGLTGLGRCPDLQITGMFVP